MMVDITTAGKGWGFLQELRERAPVRCAMGLRHTLHEVQAAVRAAAATRFNLKPSRAEWIMWGLRGSDYVNPSDLVARLWIDPKRWFLGIHDEGGTRRPMLHRFMTIPTKHVQRTGEGMPRSFDLPSSLEESASRSRVFVGVGGRHGREMGATWRGHDWLFRREAGTVMSKRLYRTVVKGMSRRIPGMGGLKASTRSTILRPRPILKRTIMPLYLLERSTAIKPNAWWSDAIVKADPIAILGRWLEEDVWQ